MKTVYVDMDDVLCDFSSAFNRDLALNPDMRFPQSQYGFFEKLLPISGGIECITALLNTDQYEPYILTAPSSRNPFSYTEKRVWIEKHLGFHFVDRLIICSNKGLLRGDILIDDNINGKGQETFQGRIIQFGSDRYPDWAAVRNELASFY